jgi:hypothetical protein
VQQVDVRDVAVAGSGHPSRARDRYARPEQELGRLRRDFGRTCEQFTVFLRPLCRVDPIEPKTHIPETGCGGYVINAMILEPRFTMS